MVSGNRILGALAPSVRTELQRSLETVDLRFGEVLAEAGEPLRFAYFPHKGVISLLQTLPSGDTAETGTVGPEGMVESASVLGADVAMSRSIVQVAGSAGRIQMEPFRRLLGQYPQLRALLNGYLQAFFKQLLHSIACNGLHSAEERCARWLLMTHDRVGSDSFPITQEFLAEMLGVRRTTVGLVAGALQSAGLIRYRRGQMNILDRPGLEQVSCECYGIMRSAYESLLPKAPG